MSAVPDSTSARRRRGPRHVGRWIVIVVASLLLHLAALDLLPHWTLRPADEPPSEPLRARLMPPVQTPETAKEQPPVQREIPREQVQAALPKPRRAPPRQAPPPEFAPESATPVPQVAVGPAETPTPTTTPQPAAAAPVPDAAPPAPVEPAPPATPPAPATVTPSSARLDYKVVYVDAKSVNPVTYYGVGAIDWSIADGRYDSALVAAVDFLLFKVDVLASHSEGGVGPGGLAPDRYTETPRRKSTVATSFNRDARQTISFSASSATAPLVPGVQDRLSVLFQIGALLLAQSAGPLPGQRIEIPVAGVRGDVETWAFETQGEEAIDAAGAERQTTHLRRAPRAGTNDRTIDVWIAQKDGGYPARVLYTEPNGSTIEMRLVKIGAAP